jgi:hypothetical protein
VTQSLIGINFLSSHAVSGPGGESTESSNFSKDFGYREEPFWAQPRGTVFPTLPRGAPLPAGWGRVNRSLVNSAPEPPRFPRRPAASAAVMASQAIGLDDMLSEIAGTGIRHVRWVVVGDGRSLPPPTAVTASVHWQWSPPSLRWVAASPDAAGVSPLLSDLYRALCAFRRTNMRMLPVLFSFEFFRHSVALTDNADNRYWPLMTTSGVASLMTGIVEPLLAVIAEFPDVICGCELINEPDWCIPRREGGGGGPDAVLSYVQMIPFLSEGISRINVAMDVINRSRATQIASGAEKRRYSTIGYASLRTLRNWNISRNRYLPPTAARTPAYFGVRQHQFHRYGNRPSYLESPEVLPDAPCNNIFLGEVGAHPELARNILDADIFGSTLNWDRSVNPTTSVLLRDRLNACVRRGYYEVYLWLYDQRPEDPRFRGGSLDGRAHWNATEFQAEISAFRTRYPGI